MKQFNIPCFFNGVRSSVTVYIGNPLPDHNPIHFQSDWLSKERGGSIPPEILESLNKILALSIKNNVPFLELCEYALNAANESIAANKDSVQNQAITQEKDSKLDNVIENQNAASPAKNNDTNTNVIEVAPETAPIPETTATSETTEKSDDKPSSKPEDKLDQS